MLHVHHQTTHTNKVQSKDPSESIKYTQKDVTFQDTPLFFPQGLEHIFLTIYFMILPYIFGLIFLFFYIAQGDYNIFFALNDTNSYILTWAIGYEVIATFTILIIMKNAIVFSLRVKTKSNRRQFVIP